MVKYISCFCIFAVLLGMSACGNEPETIINKSRSAAVQEMSETYAKPAKSQGNLFNEDNIDVKFKNKEAENAKDLAINVLDNMYNGDEYAFAETYAEYSDIDMIYYGAFGYQMESDSLTDAVKNELEYLADFLPETGDRTVTDVQIADADDIFWKSLSPDSELMQFFSYPYDMSGLYSFDKAYKVIFSVQDTDHPENSKSDVPVYIARVNGEWKFECLVTLNEELCKERSTP